MKNISKKIFACSVVFAMLLGLFSASMPVQANEDDCTNYVSINLSTGEEEIIPISNTATETEAAGYTPAGAKQPRLIIGIDDRIPVSDTSYDPYPKVGLIRTTWRNGVTTTGTGWMFGPNDVATVAHNLYSAERGGAAQSIQYYPAYNPGHIPYGVLTARNIIICEDFVTQDDSQYDYGVFDLNNNVGNSTGYFGWNSNVIPNSVVASIGYPEDYHTQMVHSFGDVYNVYSNYFTHSIDTLAGDSGAPVLFGSSVIGIHSGSTSILNTATRISGSVANLLQNRRLAP